MKRENLTTDRLWSLKLEDDFEMILRARQGRDRCAVLLNVQRSLDFQRRDIRALIDQTRIEQGIDERLARPVRHRQLAGLFRSNFDGRVDDAQPGQSRHAMLDGLNRQRPIFQTSPSRPSQNVVDVSRDGGRFSLGFSDESDARVRLRRAERECGRLAGKETRPAHTDFARDGSLMEFHVYQSILPREGGIWLGCRRQIRKFAAGNLVRVQPSLPIVQ